MAIAVFDGSQIISKFSQHCQCQDRNLVLSPKYKHEAGGWLGLWFVVLGGKLCKIKRCFNAITFVLCFRISHQKGKTKLGRTGSECINQRMFHWQALYESIAYLEGKKTQRL
jgi:hypothetical protein